MRGREGHNYAEKASPLISAVEGRDIQGQRSAISFLAQASLNARENSPKRVTGD